MQVFLSYAHDDEAFAKELSAELEKHGLSVWSEEEVLPGDNFHLSIGDALEKSEAMVVLISPESMKSRWVRWEIEYALGNPNFEGRLFPVQVRPTKEAPWILERFTRYRASEGPKKISRSIANVLKDVA